MKHIITKEASSQTNIKPEHFIFWKLHFKYVCYKTQECLTLIQKLKDVMTCIRNLALTVYTFAF